MLIDLYSELIIMTFVFGVLYLILKIFSNATLKYFKASWHYYSYFIVYTFLLLPYHKIISLFGFSQKIRPILSLPFLTSSTELSLTNSPDVIVMADTTAADTVAIVSNKNISMILINFLPYFLIAGSLVFIVVILIQNIKIHRHIFSVCRLSDDLQFQDVLSRCKQKNGITKNISLYLSPYASTPFLYGIINPRIVLPDIEFTSEELQHVFQHELTHWKRHDAWLKCLMLLMNAIHWFNPIAYIDRYNIDRFCELSCDESVVSAMNHDERRRYCELMLGVLWNVTCHNAKLFSAFSDKRKQLERRMSMIMKTEGLKGKIKTRIFAIAITLALLTTGSVVAYATSGNENTPNNGGLLSVAPDKSNIQATAEIQEQAIAVPLTTTQLSENVDGNVDVINDAEGKIGGGLIQATNTINWDISSKSTTTGSTSMSMESGETITLNVSISPSSASIDVGILQPDGSFRYVNTTSGSVNHTFDISDRGQYKVRIRNNSSSTVSVSGFVNY